MRQWFSIRHTCNAICFQWCRDVVTCCLEVSTPWRHLLPICFPLIGNYRKNYIYTYEVRWKWDRTTTRQCVSYWTLLSTVMIHGSHVLPLYPPMSPVNRYISNDALYHKTLSRLGILKRQIYRPVRTYLKVINQGRPNMAPPSSNNQTQFRTL
jgi:hypothetical protein